MLNALYVYDARFVYDAMLEKSIKLKILDIFQKNMNFKK
jgi:hypothetical protein